MSTSDGIRATAKYCTQPREIARPQTSVLTPAKVASRRSPDPPAGVYAGLKMSTHHRTCPRRFWCAVLVAASLTLTGCGSTPHRSSPSQTPVGERFQQYVALGDSSAAGPVIRPQQTNQPRECERSAVNFPSLVAHELAVAAFVDETCSGATSTTAVEGDRGLPAQVSAVTRSTDLVTIGPIGANDIDLVDTALGCIVPGCATRLGPRLAHELAGTHTGIRRLIEAVKRRAPTAKIVVIGYGLYLPRGGCPNVQPISPKDGNFLQGLLDTLNEVLRSEAHRAKVSFLDLATIPGATKHTACAPAGTRWLQGLLVGSTDGAIAYHPTSIGMRTFARAVVAAVR